MFTVYLFVFALLSSEVEPVYIDRFKSIEACQIAAAKANIEAKEALERYAELGPRFVCAELKAPTV